MLMELTVYIFVSRASFARSPLQLSSIFFAKENSKKAANTKIMVQGRLERQMVNIM
jgi:hypothetical protein